ncbi:MAG: hypothetical protein JW723_00710 [Bacteroidales bacterium]|nr:hypothetical protein [Bacteroidales bacterium]
MIENLINGLKDQIGDQILSKTDVKRDQLNGILSVIGSATQKEVKSSMKKDGFNTIMNLFSDKPNNSFADTLQSNIGNSIVAGLIKKLGLSQSTASAVSAIVVPALMKLVTKKNNETPEDDPSPLKELFGDKSGMGNLAGNLISRFLNPKKK